MTVEGSETIASFSIISSGSVYNFTSTYADVIDLDKSNIFVTIFSNSGVSRKMKLKNNSDKSRYIYFTVQSSY